MFAVVPEERLKEISRDVVYDTRTNGSGSIMRIYCDIRFSQDRPPSPPRLRMVFWEGSRRRTENPKYFVSMNPDGGDVYGGKHRFKKGELAAFVRAAAREPSARKLEETLELITKMGNISVGGEYYTHVQVGYSPDHKGTGLLCKNGLYALSPKISLGLLSCPECGEVCFGIAGTGSRSTIG